MLKKDVWKNPLIIDLGSGSLKYCVLESSEYERIPAVIGKSKYSREEPDVLGWKLRDSKNKYDFLRPLDPSSDLVDVRGIIRLIKHVFSTIKERASETAIFLLYPDYCSLDSIERLKSGILKQLGVPALIAKNEYELFIKLSKYNTGVIIDSGYSSTRVVPFLNYSIMRKSARASFFAGHQLTQYLLDLLLRKYPFLHSVTNILEIQQVKEELCYLSRTFNEDLSKTPTELGIGGEEHLSGEQTIELDIERILVPEAIFSPKLLKATEDSLFSLLALAIQKCPVHLRKAIFKNIYFIGGNVLFDNFLPRFSEEIKKIPLLTDVNFELTNPCYCLLEMAQRALKMPEIQRKRLLHFD